jgi:hypothetical protein
MSRPPLAQLFAYADRRFGVLTIDDARRYGVTERVLLYRSAQRVIERLDRGVYRVVGAHDEWHQRLVVALAKCGPTAVASHRSAAALHRLDGFGTGPLDLIVAPTVQRRSASATVRRMVLASSERCKVGIVPATTPARTIVDLGSIVDEGTLIRALDSAERDGRVRRQVLVECLERSQRRRGTAVLRRVLGRREAIGQTPQSVLERDMLDLLVAHGLPEPICQHAVRRADGREARLDLAYPASHLAIEVDGNEAHATPARRRADNVRSNHLPGWRLLRFTYEEVHDEPAAVAAAVRLNLRS